MPGTLQDFLNPPWKHFRPAYHDHVAATSGKKIAVAATLNQVARAHLGGISRKLYEQFPVAAHRKLHAAGERAAQPRRWKSSLTVGDTKDLPQFRGRIHLRDLGLTKELMGLLQK